MKISLSNTIPGVKILNLRAFGDPRGQFLEVFRKEWFPERTWDTFQSNRSDSEARVLRGLHYHHHQVDYWHVSRGEIRVALVDVRRSSPAFGAAQVLDLSCRAPAGLFIPIGVAHGFLATTFATLCYIVDNYYDGGDELGIAWDDPALGIDWGTDRPQLSERDRQNPLLHDIPMADLPE